MGRLKSHIDQESSIKTLDSSKRKQMINSQMEALHKMQMQKQRRQLIELQKEKNRIVDNLNRNE